MRFLVTIIICFFALGVAIPQNTPVRFERMTAKDGLSQGHILCMIQDSEGYVWAGTYHGLNRYNGYNFDVFYADKNKPGSLFINVVYSLFEDCHGNIWCGTWGIDVFDRKSESFRHIPAMAGKNSLSAGEVSAIAQDRNGNMWFATQGGGLNKYNPSTGEMQYFRSDIHKENALHSDFLNDIRIDHDQMLWIATEGGGLSKLNIRDETIVTYRHTKANKNSLPSDKISCLFEDINGNLWLGDNEGALSRYNPARNQFEIHPYTLQKATARKSRIMQITQDRLGNILLATNGSGLIIYNVSARSSLNFILHNDNPETLISNENSSILVDRTNTIFIGSYGRGISKFSPFSNKFDVFVIPENNGTNSDINAFTDGIEDFSGHLITGTYNGFLVFNKQDWTYKHYLPGNSYEENKILTLEMGPDSSLWLSSMKSLHRYDKNFNKISSYIFDPLLKDHSIYSIEFDSNNDLWIALFTKGLLRIPEQEWRNKKKPTLKYTLYTHDDGDSNTISGNQQWVIFCDTLSQLWIGGLGGLDSFNYQRNTFSHICNPGTVKTIDFDSDGRIWMGTIGEGLVGYDPSSKMLKRYTVEDGLSHSFIYGILADSEDKLWISSESGLTRFDINAESFRRFDKRDGLASDHFDDKSESMLSDGTIYMGTNNGFVLFRPENIKEDTSDTRIVLTSLTIDNNKLYYYENKLNDSIQHIPVGQVSRIDIGRHQRDIELGFAALHFASPHKIQYQYRLEPYDKKWITTSANSRWARYTNLSGGTYIFHVKATNSDGKWMNSPLKIEIIVHPPLYKTYTFRILVALVLIMITLLLFRWRINVEIRQREVLARLVDTRTAEVTKKNIQLETIAANLRESNTLLEERQQYILEQSEELAAQRDELVQLNATKDKLFSVIAHDLKNPFNVIIGYTDLLIARINDWNHEKKLYFLQLLKESSESAYGLLENLLNWSRSQSGVLQFNPEVKPVNEIIRFVLPDVENFARKKEIQIINKTENESTLVKIDIHMITAVIRNLVMNAIKFCQNGNKITIDASLLNKKYMKFMICDEGIGMTEEEVSNLFLVNKNKSTPGTGGEKGTGLGLLLCKDFVGYHKGEIWAESTPNKGTIFFFTVPLAV
jgi:signal transduction histidine kinase/ligand-binding sensor domain-containing protein